MDNNKKEKEKNISIKEVNNSENKEMNQQDVINKENKKDLELKEIQNKKEEIKIDLKYINTDINIGLTSEEIENRRKIFGFNENIVPKPNPIIKFLKKFTGLTAYVLEITAIIAFSDKSYIDGGVIIALLLLNALLGFFQEKRASGY